MRLLLVFGLILIVHSHLHSQVLITNTTIVDVVNKKVLHSQNVLVRNGIITAIGSKVRAPRGTQIIQGEGKYLIPGFVDSHVHFFQSGGLFTRPDIVDLRAFKPYEDEIAWTHANMENILRRYASAGITTVVDVGSTIPFLQQRDTFGDKDYAPTIYMTGPLLVTKASTAYKDLHDHNPFYEMKTEEDARNYVRKQLPYKPDFIKIGFIVSGTKNIDSLARQYLPLVKAAIDEAHLAGLRVAVHTFQVGTAQLAVEAGADRLVHTPFDKPVTSEFIQLLKNKRVAVASSVIVFEGYRRVLGQSYRPTENDLSYAHPEPLRSIQELKNLPDTVLVENLRKGVQQGAARAKKSDSLLRANLKRIVNEGVIVSTATDAGNIGTQHVSSYFEELSAMQQCGFDMWQLLQSSTINGALAVRKENEFGSIEIGKRADLLLLSKDPLANLDNWKLVEWVIIKGKAHRPDEIKNHGSGH